MLLQALEEIEGIGPSLTFDGDLELSGDGGEPAGDAGDLGEIED